MGNKEQADESMKKLYQKGIATKLLDGIEQLSDRASSKRRWIWELLQNAKDVANEKVRVEILLTKDYVEFRHNGNSFSIDNLTHLIHQVSSKERTTETNEAPKTTGKFGTGFMTTHLLSRQVKINGILQNDKSFSYKNFEVLLDRSAINLNEMIKNVEDAFSIFEKLDNDVLYPPLANYQQNQNCDTSFRYALDNAGFEVAKVGIQDLQNAIAYALAFISTIQSVKVTDDTDDAKDSTYSYKTVNRHPIGKISIVTIEKDFTESPCETQTIACLSNDKQTITIAVEVQVLGEKRYSIKETAKEIPILFCEFPLIGSESFPYPIVINSPLLNPTEPRDSIFLNDQNEQKTSQNKAILEEATLLYGDLLNQLSSDWQNIHLLGKLKSEAKLSENIDKNWYEEKISNRIVNLLTDAPLVDTVDGHRISLKESLIPSYKLKADVDQFSELASSLHPNRLPKPDHVLDWHDILKSELGKKFTTKIRYTLDQLLQDITAQQTLDKLAIRLSKNDSDTLAWVNHVIAFTSKSSEELLDEYSVIPNQHNQFKAKEELYQDKSIPEALKDVLKILDEDWREKLAHKGLNYQLSKVLDISKAVDKIEKIIKDNKHELLRKAVYTLVSCFPTDAKFEQDTKLVSKRDTIWNFVRNLGRAVPDKIDLEKWTPVLWEEADLWLLKTLIDDIEKLENVKGLAKQLKVTPEDAISWLNCFIAFLKQEDQSLLYSKKVIFPNQEGIFKKEEELYIDDKIPDELKDALEGFGLDYRGKLLDVRIQGFEDNNKITVKDASDDIKKRLQEAKEKDKDNLEEYWSFSVPVYHLISYFPDSQSDDSNKLEIWDFASRFYTGEIPPKKHLTNLQDFSWDACNKWILNSIAKDIDNFKNLEDFVKYFNSEDRNTAIEWLDSFIYFVAENKQFLDEYAILPSQSGLFKKKKDLKKDGGIPEEFKHIIELLTSECWNDFLLYIGLTKVENLFDKEETKTIENIAIEIDQGIKNWELADKQVDSKFTKVITGMIEWSNNKKEGEVKKLFNYFYVNKAQLLLKTLNDNNVSSGIFTILNYREKLSALTNLAENPDISEKDLQDFGKNQAQFKEFKELREHISENDLSELVENKGKFNALKLLQDSADTGETSEFISALQELGVYQAVESFFGSTRADIDKEEMEAIGRKGEEFVYQKLVDKFEEKRVRWLNKDGESFGSYDFVVTDDYGKELYIDAKATPTQESIADRIPFYVGSSEWKFSANNMDNYYLARVFSIRNKEPIVKFLKFVRLLDSE